MCLCRIDYNAKKYLPSDEIIAYKVFRRMGDGTLRNCYSAIADHGVETGVWMHSNGPLDGSPNCNWHTDVKGRRGMRYPRGFHATMVNYAYQLRDSQIKKRDTKYRIDLDSQRGKVSLWKYYPDVDMEHDPLQTTLQPPTHTYVVLRVKIRGIHTTGRQRMNNATHRTWVASEMMVMGEV